MAKPHSLTDEIAQLVVIRRAAGHAVATIAKDLKITTVTVYQICNGKIRSEATRSIRWKARKLLNDVKKQRLRDKDSRIDYRTGFSKKKILISAADICIQNSERIMQESKRRIQHELDRNKRLTMLMKKI